MPYNLVVLKMSMNARVTLMVAIAMPLVTILKAPTTVSANKDFRKMEKTAAKVNNIHFTSASARDLRILAPNQLVVIRGMM